MNAVSARAGGATCEDPMESTMAWTDDTRRHYARRAARRASGPGDDGPDRDRRAGGQDGSPDLPAAGDGLTRSILKAPFGDRLVPQNPVDEPAADTLIRFAAAAGTFRGRKTGLRRA